jgi:ElaB/YqjD/DUF883 family membrane-anchored ribosome-binding protein
MQRSKTGGDDIRHKAESTAANVAEQAQQTAEIKLASQKDQAADTLHTLAEAIRDGGQRMGQEQPQIASLAGQAATKVDEASRYVREHEVRDFISEAEDFARREPLIFLGGALAVGFLAARFLKASSPQRQNRRGMGDGPRDWYAVGPGREGAASRGAGVGRQSPVERRGSAAIGSSAPERTRVEG